MAQHFFSNGLAAREEDKIELLVEQRRVFRAPARNNGHVFGQEAFPYNGFNNLACSRRISTWFQNSGVTCGNGIG